MASNSRFQPYCARSVRCPRWQAFLWPYRHIHPAVFDKVKQSWTITYLVGVDVFLASAAYISSRLITIPKPFRSSHFSVLRSLSFRLEANPHKLFNRVSCYTFRSLGPCLEGVRRHYEFGYCGFEFLCPKGFSDTGNFIQLLVFILDFREILSRNNDNR